MRWFSKKSDKISGVVQLRGSNNRVIIIECGIERPLHRNANIPGLDIIVVGNNNTIKIEMPFNSHNSSIFIMNDGVNIELGRTSAFSNVKIVCRNGHRQVCKIGCDTTINGAIIELPESSGLIIGEGCLLSDNIKIWGSDGHSIIDADTMEIINPVMEPIVVGNHVWVGESVIFTKNASVAQDSVVGAGTVCCKKYTEPNVIIAGNPGRIIRKNILWNRYNPTKLISDIEKISAKWEPRK